MYKYWLLNETETPNTTTVDEEGLNFLFTKVEHMLFQKSPPDDSEVTYRRIGIYRPVS